MAKRKPKGVPRRKRATREPYERVLVLGVGKSERVYFEEMRVALGLSSVNVRISEQAEGQDPLSMVETALELREVERDQGENFDQIWCIFDRDRFHQQFWPALKQANTEGVQVAWSMPCFEYWLLIHFEATARPFRAAGKRTGAQCCERELRNHINGYRKGQSDVFQCTWPRVDQAIGFAKHRLRDAADTDEANPSTTVHKLVDYLRTIKGNNDHQNPQKNLS